MILKQDNNWLFYCLYPKNVNLLDKVLLDIIEPLSFIFNKEEDYTKWFFMRYWDSKGCHIRLRYLTTETGEGKIRGYIENDVSEKLENINYNPLELHKPIIPISQFPDTPTLISKEVYIPEYEKYGGIEGVKIAEDLFECSSNLTLLILKEERVSSINRYYIALYIMYKAISSIIRKKKSISRFFANYIHYWSGGDTDRGEEFREKLSFAVEKRIGKVMEDWNLIEKMSESISLVPVYLEKFENSIRLIKECSEIDINYENIAFHYLHMTNNRLGITTLEEAYLAKIIYEFIQNK